MTFATFAAILVSALAWAGYDTTRKAMSKKIDALPLVAALTGGQIPLFFIVVSLQGWPQVGNAYWPGALASLALNTAANLMFLASLRRAPISMAIPLLALSPVFTAAIEALWLKDVPLPTQALGITLVLIGTAILSQKALRERQDGHPHLRTGLILMMATAFAWAAAGVFDRKVIPLASPAFHALLQVSGIFIATSLALVVSKQIPALRALFKFGPLYIFSLFLAAVALGLQFVAFQSVAVAIVEAGKRGVGMILSALSGKVFFEEELDRRHIFAIPILIVGVVFVLHH